MILVWKNHLAITKFNMNEVKHYFNKFPVGMNFI